MRATVAFLLLVPVAATGGIIGDAEVYRRADADGSNSVNVADAQYTLDYLFSGGPAPSCMDAADSNTDGVVSQADAVFTLDWLFNGGPAPTAPGPYQCEKALVVAGCANPTCP